MSGMLPTASHRCTAMTSIFRMVQTRHRRPLPHRAAKLWACLLVLILMSMHVLQDALAEQPRRSHKSIAAKPVAQRQSPEARLIDIYRLIGQADLKTALAKADALVADQPNFSLAQLVRGDLLLAHSRPLPEFAALRAAGVVPTPRATPVVTANGNGAAQNLVLTPPTLEDLREEALQRMRALRERPAAGSVPASFVALAEITRDALLVDVSRSRLYHYQHRNGKVELVADYYMSHGRLGASKEREGDQRTPLGIYYVTSSIERSRLDDFYGAGALTINFPNELDKKRQRTGSGIWLHGVPDGERGTYARAPRASDGCVVLANDDLRKLLASIKPAETPIVITQQAVWLPEADWQRQRASFKQLFNDWVAARNEPGNGRFRQFYSPSFESYGERFGTWLPRRYATGVTQPPQHATLLHMGGPDELLVATFYDVNQTGSRTSLTRKRQYWHKVDGRWKIFFEGALG